MAKVIVEIDLPGVSVESIQSKSNWRIDAETISIDSAYLKLDPKDDSFYAFKVIRLEEDG